MIAKREEIQRIVVQAVRQHVGIALQDRELYNITNNVELDDVVNDASRQLLLYLSTYVARTKDETITKSKTDTEETEFVPASGMDYFRLWLNTNYPRLLKFLRLTLIVEYRPMLITTIQTTTITNEYYCPHTRLNETKCFTFLSLVNPISADRKY